MLLSTHHEYISAHSPPRRTKAGEYHKIHTPKTRTTVITIVESEWLESRWFMPRGSYSIAS
jgi:hypothetical protein